MEATGKRPAFITAMEFRERIGPACLSKAALYDALARGHIKNTRIGGRILIPASELDRLLADAGGA